MFLVKVISGWLRDCAGGLKLYAPCRVGPRLHPPRTFKLIVRLFIFSIVFNGFSGARAGAYEDYWAAIRQDAPANVLRLVLGGFDPNTRDAEGNTGLTLALSDSSFKVAEVLLALDAVDVKAVNHAGWDALSLAAFRGNEEALRRLIERNVPVPKSGLTPLHHAARGGHVQAMRLLLERGSSVDALGPRGNTPLMLASGFGSPESVKFLLEAGAQPRLRNQLGHDALHLAQLQGNTETAKLLAPLVPRSETAARLPARRPSAATQTPALEVGPPTSASRPAARAAATASAAVVEPFAPTDEAARQASSPAVGPGIAAIQASVTDWIGGPLRALRQALTPTAPAPVEAAAAPSPAAAVLRGPQNNGATRTTAGGGAAAEPAAASATAALQSSAAQRPPVTAPAAASFQAPRRIVFVPPPAEPRGESTGPKTGW